MKPAQYADNVLTHYIVQALRQSGVEITSDTYAELEGVISRALDPIDSRIRDLEMRVEQLRVGQHRLLDMIEAREEV